MKQYLLIENKGIAPVEGYTVLGFSTARDSKVQGVIGQFGSGANHAISVCLRLGLVIWVYCGKTRLEFSTETETVSDGIDTKEVQYVQFREGQKQWKRTGWVLDFGESDWVNVGMALRELIANAIDRTLREGGFEENHLAIMPVDEKDRRAKSGTTRVYVEMNDAVREYFGQLGVRFLHFSDNPKLAQPGILEKANRCPEGSEGAVIYREGVYVRTLLGKSMFDYNFSRSELTIDECRNSSDYRVRAAIARLLGSASTDILSRVFKAAQRGDGFIEMNLDQGYIFGSYYCAPSEKQEATWAKAWEIAAGPDAVVCDEDFVATHLINNGHKVAVINNDWSKSLKRITAVPNSSNYLDQDEQRGDSILDATEDAEAAVDWAWKIFEAANLVGDKEKPPVKCFRCLDGSSKPGEYKADMILIHIDLANNGQNNELRKIALESVARWLTGNSCTFYGVLIDALVAFEFYLTSLV
jgi:hypothetical protein